MPPHMLLFRQPIFLSVILYRSRSVRAWIAARQGVASSVLRQYVLPSQGSLLTAFEASSGNAHSQTVCVLCLDRQPALSWSFLGAISKLDGGQDPCEYLEQTHSIHLTPVLSSVSTPLANYCKGRKKDQQDSKECYFKFMVQKNGHRTTRVMKLPLKMPQTPMRVLSNVWTGKQKR